MVLEFQRNLFGARKVPTSGVTLTCDAPVTCQDSFVRSWAPTVSGSAPKFTTASGGIALVTMMFWFSSTAPNVVLIWNVVGVRVAELVEIISVSVICA